jgi:hypothetical protein
MMPTRESPRLPNSLAQPLPRITATALARADKSGEMAIHAAMRVIEGRGKVQRLAVLIAAWNRCTDAQRERFLALLRTRELGEDWDL